MTTLLTTKDWSEYERIIRLIGERRFVGDPTDIELLRALNMLLDEKNLALTDAGKRYFEAKFIRREHDVAKSVLADCVTGYGPASAILQMLAGLKTTDRRAAETVLRSYGFGDSLDGTSLNSLLLMMQEAGLVRFSPSNGKLTVLVQPAKEKDPPTSVFISQDTPYANRVWLRRIIEQCRGYVYWLDKHFMASGLEPLWEAADASNISEIRILSLLLPDNSSRAPLRDYRNLKTELARKSIELEWRVIDSKSIRDTHDRWIIGENVARNVPNVGAIMSGQKSELNLSTQSKELRALFEGYWQIAVPIDLAVQGNQTDRPDAAAS